MQVHHQILGIIGLTLLSAYFIYQKPDINTNITPEQTNDQIQNQNGSITLPDHGSDNDPSLAPKTKITKEFSSSLQNQMKSIYNEKGLYINQEAAKLYIKPEDAAAIIKVESAGHGFSSNSHLMVIRFENYQFYKYYTNKGKNEERLKIFQQHFKYDQHQTWKGQMWRKDPNGEWESFHGNQQKEWEVLQFAQGLDDQNALMSASYGAGQIMGFNYSLCGYNSVQAMFKAFSGSIKAQLNGMFSFIQHNRTCIHALMQNPTDYVRFASCYNGSGQAEAYGKLIKNAAQAYEEVVKFA